MGELFQTLGDWRPLIAAGLGVAGLLFLILARGVHPFVALTGAALAVGLAARLEPEAVLTSVRDGFAGVLGFIAVIVGLGALLGVYLEASGGAAALARLIIGKRKAGASSIAMGAVGIVIAIPVFFDVGLILLFPLVQALAKKAGKPALYFGLPLLAGLAAAHAFIPPTPGPVAVAEILGADIGLVIIAGLCAAVPAVMIAGPAYAHFAVGRGWIASGAELSDTTQSIAPETGVDKSPDKAIALRALAAILVPIALIVFAAVCTASDIAPDAGSQWVAFLGHPFVALMAGCAFAAWVLKPSDEAGKARLQDGLARALEPTAVILLVTGAGGAFKQMLVDTNAGEMLAKGLLGFGLTPLIAAFALAAAVRIAQGSATVAMLTAAGLCAPLALEAGLGAWDLALMVIAIAAGASVVSHVNDSGFWLVSRYFGIDVNATLKSWTVASTLVGLVGFIMVLIMASLF